MGCLSRMRTADRMLAKIEDHLKEIKEPIVIISGGIPELYDSSKHSVAVIDIDNMDDEEPENASKQWYLDQIYYL
jgi:hypothetical protein